MRTDKFFLLIFYVFFARQTSLVDSDEVESLMCTTYD